MIASSVVRRKSCAAVASSPLRLTIGKRLNRQGSQKPIAIHEIPSVVGRVHQDSNDKDRQRRLYCDAVPRVHLTRYATPHKIELNLPPLHPLLQGNPRTFSTATTTTKPPEKSTGSQLVHSVSLSSTPSSEQNSSNERHNDDDDDTDEAEKQTWKQRAEGIRDNARESLQEFRERPGESMKSGAKTFSGMMRIYGPVFFGCHVAVYFATLGGLFVGVDSGLLDPASLMSVIGNGAAEGAAETKNTVDYVVEWMKNHSWSAGMAPFIERNPHFASLAVAWIAVKFTEPMRLPVSLFLTPRVARYLGRKPENVDNNDDEANNSDEAGHSPSAGDTNENTKADK